MEPPAERYHTLLQVSNALVSNLTEEALLSSIAPALQRALPFERVALFLHEPARDALRLVLLESSLSSAYFAVGLEFPVADSHVGEVFRSQRPLLRPDLGRERAFQAEELAYADGIRSYVIAPLVVRGRSIGALAVASTVAGRYGEADAEFLLEVATQVALAVENMKAYEEITALNARVREEAAQRGRAEAMLRSVVEGTAAATGADFFRSLVRHLAQALDVRYAFVSECRDGEHVRTLAFWKGGEFGEDVEYAAAATPCRGVLAGEACHYPSGVQAAFPRDRDLVELRAESYLGVPMIEGAGGIVGHIAVLDDRPMTEGLRSLPLLRTFAARAAAELRRQQAEEALARTLAELEALGRRLAAENVYLQEEIHIEHNFAELVGSSPALLDVLRRVERVAPTDSTVLVTGETGTGKELIARAIHRQSARRDRPLVKVNCSAISAGLVESELFGHVKGAFTGALERRVGRFELADGGTLFLDEVGELPLETQAKLLRVLQERELEPVGSSRTITVDVRVIAATNRDLEEAVRSGRFRADLFYRLNVFPLAMPPLRGRRSDIPQLVRFFLAQCSSRFGKRVDTVSEATMRRLVDYAWPGNVRELANVVERAVILTRGRELDLDHEVLDSSPEAVPLRPAATGPAEQDGAADAGLDATLQETERQCIRAALERSGWVIEGPRGAARMLKLHPNTLRSRIERLGIRRPGHDAS